MCVFVRKRAGGAEALEVEEIQADGPARPTDVVDDGDDAGPTEPSESSQEKQTTENAPDTAASDSEITNADTSTTLSLSSHSVTSSPPPSRSRRLLYGFVVRLRRKRRPKVAKSTVPKSPKSKGMKHLHLYVQK